MISSRFSALSSARIPWLELRMLDMLPPDSWGTKVTMPARSTGFPQADASTDFLRARRGRQLHRLAGVLRRESGDLAMILPFEEVVDALGRAGERYEGLRSIPIDAIVGTVDRTREFDRAFRPMSGRVRGRWERIAAAMRRGGAPRQGDEPGRSRRSPSTGSASSTSSATATTACPWPGPSATSPSTAT